MPFKDKARAAAYRAAYRASHRDHQATYNHTYYAARKDEAREKAHTRREHFRASATEEQLAERRRKAREYAAVARVRRREELNARQRARYDPAYMAAYNKTYRAQHRERIKAELGAQAEAVRAAAFAALSRDVEWRPVVGMEQLYEVSINGDIRRTSYGVGTRIGRLLKGGLNHKGYAVVTMGRTPAGRAWQRFRHHIVALAFVGPRPTPQHEINHMNGVKLDNRAQNLEWVTPEENTAHAIAHGLRVRSPFRRPR